MADDTVNTSVDPFASAVSADDPSAPKEPTLPPEKPVARVLPEEKPEAEPKVEPVVEDAAKEAVTEEPEKTPAEPKTADEIKALRDELAATREFARKEQSAKDRAEAALKQITPAQEKSFRETLETQFPIINNEEAFQKRCDEVGFFKAQLERDAAKDQVRERIDAAKDYVRREAELQARKESAGADAIAYGEKAGLTKEQVSKIIKIYGGWANQAPEDALESAKAAIDLHAPTLVKTETAESLARATEKKIRTNLAKSVPGGGLGAGAQPADSKDWRVEHLAKLEKAFAPDVRDPFV